MKKIGDKMTFTGGAEEISPKVTVKEYKMQGSLNDGKATLHIQQIDRALRIDSICISPETLQAILNWYNGV